MTKVSHRLRRSADEARRQILDAAEELLSRFGPAGLRLQDVAKNVGVSHPTILHHFGSRGGLVDAVVQRSIETVYDDLVSAVQECVDQEPHEVLSLLYDRISCAGQTRVLAWLILSNYELFSGGKRVRRIAELVHGLREQRWRDASRPVPPFEDTLFTVTLLGLVFFGDEVAGAALMREAGFDDGDQARQRFRRWLSGVIMERLSGEPAPSEQPAVAVEERGAEQPVRAES